MKTTRASISHPVTPAMESSGVRRQFSRSSADSKKSSKTPEWKQLIGYASSTHPRLRKSERKQWKKRDEHRQEAAIVY